MAFAHSEADVIELLKVYDEVLPALGSAIKERRLGNLLRCRPLEPLFGVR